MVGGTLESNDFESEGELAAKHEYHTDVTIDKIPPGQIYPLVIVDSGDLFRDEHTLKSDTLTFNIKYNPPERDILGYIRKRWAKLWKKEEHVYLCTYTFRPDTLTFFPSTEYIV